MRRGFCKIWISVVGIAVVTSVAGCCGHDAPFVLTSISMARALALRNVRRAAHGYAQVIPSCCAGRDA